ncbi:sulfurtransferase TusA family protein [Oryzibacter oryziterrae]|uniref:sulfurtransferase TusA family protein n=1 Tax=Oryzibacter oryziterrae TaxID=2766474 RepID=UPI001F37B67D|nr:sulfurtransferase TusA family protein [Oryzibacter oryziterrae]
MTEGDRHLDLRGLLCPLPVLKSRKALRDMVPGACLTVDATDEMTVIDIPHFCREDGHLLEEQHQLDGGILRFVIRKG